MRVSCVFRALGSDMCLCVSCLCCVCVMRVACGCFVCVSGSWVCHVFVHMYHDGRLWVFRVFSGSWVCHVFVQKL